MRSIKKRRKNYFPTLTITLLLWLISVIIFVFVNPTSFTIIAPFVIMITLALFFTFSLLLGNSRSGLFATLIIVSLVLLKRMNTLSIFSGVIVVAVLTTVNLLFKKER